MKPKNLDKTYYFGCSPTDADEWIKYIDYCIKGEENLKAKMKVGDSMPTLLIHSNKDLNQLKLSDSHRGSSLSNTTNNGPILSSSADTARTSEIRTFDSIIDSPKRESLGQTSMSAPTSLQYSDNSGHPNYTQKSPDEHTSIELTSQTDNTNPVNPQMDDTVIMGNKVNENQNGVIISHTDSTIEFEMDQLILKADGGIPENGIEQKISKEDDIASPRRGDTLDFVFD